MTIRFVRSIIAVVLLALCTVFSANNVHAQIWGGSRTRPDTGYPAGPTETGYVTGMPYTTGGGYTMGSGSFTSNYTTGSGPFSARPGARNVYQTGFGSQGTGFTLPSSDDKGPIEITGDYVEYRVNEDRVVAKGAATVRRKDMDLIANNIEADIENEQVFAQGDVILWRRDEKGKQTKIAGDFLVYHLKTGQGFLKNATVYQEPTLIKSPRVDLSSIKITAPKGALWTSCDKPLPHFSLRAKSVTVYPHKVMYLKHITYRVGNFPLLYLPYRAVNLSDKKKEFDFRYGYSKLKGYFLGTSWDYFINVNQDGDLSWEHSEKGGDYFKINHKYKMWEKLTGTMLMDHSFDKIRQNTIDRLNLGGSLRTGERNSLQYTLNYFSDMITNQPANKELNVTANFSHSEQNYQVNVMFKNRIDVDGDEYTADDNMRFINNIPEVTINTNRVKLGKLPLNLSTTHRLGTREEKSLKDVVRRNITDSRFTIDSDRFSFSKMTSLNLNSYYQTRQENRDERQEILAGGAAFAQKIGQYLSSTWNYENVRTLGIYPFETNRIENQNRLQTRLTYTGKSHKIGTTINSNLFSAYYDLQKKPNQPSALNGAQSDVTLTFKQNRENEYRLYVRANYEYDDTALSDIWHANMRTPKLYYKLDMKLSDVFNWQNSTSYDRIANKSDALNSTLRFTVDPFWAFDVQAIYDSDKKEMRNLSYIVQRDLHCAYATFRANPKLREYFLELGLKAFQEDRRGFNWDKTARKIKMQKNTGGGLF